MKHRRILARLALICIALLLCSLLLIACFDIPNASGWLMAILFCLIVIPAVIYGLFMLIKRKEEQKED